MTRPALPPASARPRTLPADPQTLLGAGEHELRARLGEPARREPGESWPSERPGHAWVRVGTDLREAPYFGPPPPPIERGAPYERWIYRGVARPGSEEALTVVFLLAGRRGHRLVVAAHSHPSGAIA